MYRLLAFAFILMLGANSCPSNNEVRVTGDGEAVEVRTERVKYLRCITAKKGELVFDGYVDGFNLWSDRRVHYWINGHTQKLYGVSCIALTGDPRYFSVPGRDDAKPK